MPRIEFPAPVKRALAERAGFRCSFPTCNCQTVGPSEETPEGVNRTGTACHIYAASDGTRARRVPHGMLAEDRASIANGIWMCDRHADLIDGDEVRYPPEMLVAWRKLAELKAKLRQETGREIEFGSLVPSGATLVQQEITFLGIGAENETIGNALRHSCVYDLWGQRNGDAARDLLIELIRNAFTHGGAKTANLRIEPSRIVLRDDGVEFPVDQLLEHPERRGGGAAMREFVSEDNSHAIVSSRWEEGFNETVIALVASASELAEVTPCTLTMTIGRMATQVIDIDEFATCNMIYIIPPRYIAFSDIMVVVERVAEARARKRITLVLQDVSDGVARRLAAMLTDVRILRL